MIKITKPEIVNCICEIEPEIIIKKWGFEKVLINSDSICGKILHYNSKGSMSSFHFHPIKKELFLCQSGSFIFKYKDENGNTLEKILKIGDIIYIPNCHPHQLESLEDDSEILEISTIHRDSDVIRISPGDSQK